jgi:hypothetical protein
LWRPRGDTGFQPVRDRLPPGDRSLAEQLEAQRASFAFRPRSVSSAVGARLDGSVFLGTG